VTGSGHDSSASRVFISTDAVGGVWDYTVTLSHGLVEAGHEVRLAIVGPVGDDRMAELPAAAEAVRGDFRLEWMPGADEDVTATGEWLAAESRQWGADLVHLNQMSYAASTYDAPVLVVVHSDVLSWFSESLGQPAPPEWNAYARSVGKGLAAADVVAAPSAYQSRLTELQYGRGADHVLHNGARPPAAPPLERSAPLVLSVGRAWDEAKGMAVLDRAAGLLGSGLDVHLVGDMVGPAGQRFTPRHLIAHGRAPRRQVDEWMSRASIYVGGSLYEPFGLAPLEAAFRGAALVLSDIPSFREIWDGCALFFPPGDAHALARKLAVLAPDLPRCRAMGAEARARARALYTAERFVARYKDLYASISPRMEKHPSCT
jgi:glycosyltransferase involved in cell wall biosynthesis